MNPVEEPLLESAPLAWKLALEFCRRDPATGETCAWHHGLWQFLRLMGLAGSAARRGAFYQDATRDALADVKSPRVLISGSTDYAMLALVAAALKDRLEGAAITIVDICETPLRLGQWYAERSGTRLNVARSDILDYDPREHFDLICTDSFISRFPHQQWKGLADKWRALLRPGGSVVTATLLRPDAAVECIRFSEEQVVAFRETVRRLAEERPVIFGNTPADLAASAERYARNQYNHPVRTKDEVRVLLEDAGFAVDRMPMLSPHAENPAGISAPTVPKHGAFLGVIAHRN